jgi:hypothetical protein
MKNFDMRYENLIKDAENKNINKDKKDNQIFSTLKMRGIKYNLQNLLDYNVPSLDDENNEDNQEISIKKEKNKSNKTSQILLKKFHFQKKTNNQVKLRIIKNILNKKIINPKNDYIMHAYSAINIKDLPRTSKYLITKNIKRTRNSNDLIKYSKTGESSIFKNHKRKVTNYSMDKIEKTDKHSTEKSSSMFNFENSKIINNSPNFKNIQVKNKINNYRNGTRHNNTRNISYYRTKNNFDSKQFPNLFETKILKRTQSGFKSILKRGINSYTQFFQIDKYDKNIFSNIEFNMRLFREQKNMYKL